MDEPDNSYYQSDSETDFLANLGSDQFVSPEPLDKEQIKTQKQNDREAKQLILQQERDMKREIREQKSRDVQQAKLDKKSGTKKTVEDGDDGELFSSNATPILGKDKHVLLKKVQQYKSLFPAELKGFKIKKNPSVDELNIALEEMGVLVETGGMDDFMMGSVLSCMKLVEGASAATDYDIRGCADMLKSNKEFNKLCRVLFIKYNVFSKVPPEFQMVLLVSTTAYMCSQKNYNKSALNDYLNTPL